MVLKHFLVEKMSQSRSRQGNDVDTLKIAKTYADSEFMACFTSSPFDVYNLSLFYPSIFFNSHWL